MPFVIKSKNPARGGRNKPRKDNGDNEAVSEIKIRMQGTNHKFSPS